MSNRLNNFTSPNQSCWCSSPANPSLLQSSPARCVDAHFSRCSCQKPWGLPQLPSHILYLVLGQTHHLYFWNLSRIQLLLLTSNASTLVQAPVLLQEPLNRSPWFSHHSPTGCCRHIVRWSFQDVSQMMSLLPSEPSSGWPFHSGGKSDPYSGF